MDAKRIAAAVAAHHPLFNWLDRLVDVTSANQRSQIRDAWRASKVALVAADGLLEFGLITFKRQRSGGTVDSPEKVVTRVAPYITPFGREVHFAAKWLRSDEAARSLSTMDAHLYWMKRDRAFDAKRLELILKRPENRDRPIGHIVEEMAVKQIERRHAYFQQGHVEPATWNLTPPQPEFLTAAPPAR